MHNFKNCIKLLCSCDEMIYENNNIIFDNIEVNNNKKLNYFNIMNSNNCMKLLCSCDEIINKNNNIIFDNIKVNNNEISDCFNIMNFNKISFYGKSNDKLELRIECSYDGEEFFDTGIVLYTGDNGDIYGLIDILFNYIRLKVVGNTNNIILYNNLK